MHANGALPINQSRWAVNMNKWYGQLFKQISGIPELDKLKVSEDTFSENYQGDFSVADNTLPKAHPESDS